MRFRRKENGGATLFCSHGADNARGAAIWDWVKYYVKKYSRQYSMSKSKQRKAEEWQLNKVSKSLFSFSKQSQSRELINFKCLEGKQWNKCMIKRLRV